MALNGIQFSINGGSWKRATSAKYLGNNTWEFGVDAFTDGDQVRWRYDQYAAGATMTYCANGEPVQSISPVSVTMPPTTLIPPTVSDGYEDAVADVTVNLRTGWANQWSRDGRMYRSYSTENRFHRAALDPMLQKRLPISGSSSYKYICGA